MAVTNSDSGNESPSGMTTYPCVAASLTIDPQRAGHRIRVRDVVGGVHAGAEHQRVVVSAFGAVMIDPDHPVDPRQGACQNAGFEAIAEPLKRRSHRIVIVIIGRRIIKIIVHVKAEAGLLCRIGGSVGLGSGLDCQVKFSH